MKRDYNRYHCNRDRRQEICYDRRFKLFDRGENNLIARIKNRKRKEKACYILGFINPEGELLCGLVT